MNGTYLRGEVYWLEAEIIAYGNGNPMDKRRPVVIVSSNKSCERVNDVNILFMTTQGEVNDHDKVFTWASKPKKSWVICNHVYTVSKEFLVNYVGQLSPREMSSVDAKLRDFLSLLYSPVMLCCGEAQWRIVSVLHSAVK